jgi:rhodanese-related sulfurtransferase
MDKTMTETKTSIHPKDLHRLMAAGQAVELLDVRTQPEYDAVHVAGARLLPLDELDAAAFLRRRGDGDRPLYVICQSGMRSRKAIEKFRQAGFQGCVNVERGTEGWLDAGLPVERGQARVLPLIRQVQIVIGGLTAAGAALALWMNPSFAWIPLLMGCGVLMAGLTGACPLAMVMAKLPWNRRTHQSPGACCEINS